MAILGALGFLADSLLVIEWLIAPWRYLSSARYRHRKHEQWKGSALRQLADVLVGIFGFASGMAILWLGITLVIR